jgi:hypothetical protein
MSEKWNNKSESSKSSESAKLSEVDPIFNSRPEFEQFLPRRYLTPQVEVSSESFEISSQIAITEVLGAEQSAEPPADSAEPLRNFNPAQITEIISTTTRIINQLVSVNENIKANAFENIFLLEEQVAKEKSYSAHLFRDLEETRIGYQKAIEQNTSRIHELEMLVGSLSEKLKYSVEQLQSSAKWVENINSKINADLLDAIDTAERVINK